MTTLGGLRFSLVGPGRVGASLAAWAEAAGARLVSTARRGEAAALATAGQDLLLVAVPDPALAAVAPELAGHPLGAVVLHTSGSLGAEALAALRAGGSAVGTLHPLKAFPHPLPAPEQARGVFFALDGDPAAVELAGRLAAAWGGRSALVPPAARPLYHLAATLAAGGVVTLLAVAEELAGRLGLGSAEAGAVVAGYLELARGALAAAREAQEAGLPLGAALTGPAARGDRATVARQLEALLSIDPDQARLVARLARETLDQKVRADASAAPALEGLAADLDRLDPAG
ncbi:MAG TPA: Rossmann-like and DUF2520 domain-containing protein [Thermoanaerobaculia bacterium]|nr:Rossmann-like and DUF2520 domain-containing protein [Thermoanaerobaculia bacterium]